MSEVKRFYKVSDKAKLAGVCQGIAEYTNLDVGLVRVVTALLIVLGSGAPLIAYIVMAIVLPDKKEVMRELEREEVYPDNNDKKGNDNDEYGYNEDDYKL